MKQKKRLKYLKIIILLIIVIFQNSILVKATDDTVISADNWEEWKQEDYWEWYTRTTDEDKAYNGKHIVLQNDTIDFYGYGQISYKDFLYKQYQNAGKKIFKFRIDETKANYHTLDGAGFIFNANKKNNKLSGYILLFKEKDICIYRIDNVDIDTFQATPNTTIETYGKLIISERKTNNTVHDLSVETTPTNIKITEAEKEIINVNLDYTKHPGESFGLISSYLQHSCSLLSKIEISQIKIILEDYNISILNTDLENNPIRGGEFIVKNENGEVIKEGKTDKDSKFVVEGIKEGIYTVQQKNAPENYILNDNIYKFKVTSEGIVVDIDTGKEISLVVKNEKIKEEVKNEDKEENFIGNKIDNTISSTTIPNTGEENLIINFLIIVGIILAICFFKKIREYRSVK